MTKELTMIRTRLLAATAATAAAALGLAALAGASPAAAASAQTVAFSEAIAGTVTATGPGTFTLAAAGVTSPLGPVRMTGTVTVTSAPGATTLSDVLIETLTAANGDSITLRCDQTATPIGTTGVLHGVDHWTVIRGTGRYARATGSGGGDTYIYNLQLFAKADSGSISF